MADGYVQVPPDSSGKKIDSEELSTTSGTVERQRVSIPDGLDVGGDWLAQILVEQRVQNVLLAGGLRIKDDVDGLRDELSDAAGLTIPTTREFLTADRTYYVSTSGNNNNTGLSSDAAFLTFAHAWDVICGQIDFAGFAVTVSFQNTTWSAGILLDAAWTGGGSVTLDGTGATISLTADHCINIGGVTAATMPGPVNIRRFTLTTTVSGGKCIKVIGPACVNVLDGMTFGTAGQAHLYMAAPGLLNTVHDYTITGGGEFHAWCLGSGSNLLIYADSTITITGSPTFTTAFVECDTGYVESSDITFSGSVTATRYNAVVNGAINTFGAGANYFPGSSPGTTSTGGQYI